MKSFVINQNDAGQRLDKFLQKAVPLLPPTLAYKYIRLKRIKLNGKRVEKSYRLVVGDLLELYVNDEFFLDESNPERAFLAVPDKIDILYEDDNILLLDKRVGLVVHEDNDNTLDTLINRTLHYLYNQGCYDPASERSFTPALCNRIDRNTGGIVIVAKNAESLRIMNEKIKQRELEKTYLCVAIGHMPKPSDILTHYHIKSDTDNTVRVYDRQQSGTKTMITGYTVLDGGIDTSLLEVQLHTGRTHQIRAHLAHIGHPLVGDGKYGDGRINRQYNQKYQLLYAYKLKFCFKDSEPHLLSYLSERTFTAENVWFRTDYAKRFKQ